MRLALLVLFLAVVASGSAAPAPERNVILVSIDGFAAYHLDNPALVLPNLRALAARGARASGSETVFPSVTHPSHTTLITGVEPRRHGVIDNVMTNRETGQVYHASFRPRAQSILVPTIFDAAKRRGLVTAALNWPETYGDPSVDYDLTSRFHVNGGLDVSAIRPALLDELRADGVPVDAYFRWRKDSGLRAANDTVLVDAASAIIRRHRPHLLALHISATDGTQHSYGPESALAQAALSLADHHVGMLIKAVEEAGLADRTMFVIGADHGFATATHEVNVHPLFAAAGLADKVSFHPHSWSLFVREEKGFDPRKDGVALATVLAQVRSLVGVHAVYASDQFPTLGYPSFDENIHVPGQHLILGQLDTYPIAKPDGGSSERRLKAKPSHSHGYLPGDPKMYPVLVLGGAGVRAGVNLGHVRNVDVAPTILSYLGLDPLETSGRVLTEALAP